MNFKTLSRRDDLISLTYLMIFMKNGHLDFLECLNNEVDQFQIFKEISTAKNSVTAEELCHNHDTPEFLEFIQTIHGMDFKE